MERDHPHIHGEYQTPSSATTRRTGSPPHTWGIPFSSAMFYFLSRITPTYMGNTSQSTEGFAGAGDHPHIHGEYATTGKYYMPNSGSPPHTWGIQQPHEVRKAANRITPTYMGNTTEKYLYQAIIKDHPHIHGEYCSLQSRLSRLKGSPPHTWGILTWTAWKSRTARITPTYMGNT